jgi:ribosomal protein L40E
LGVVLPLQKAFAHFFGNKFVKKECPECLEQIPKDARKCKACGSVQSV